MFELISSNLLKSGYRQYEISNFSLPGFESRHNILYWADQDYWGLGLSAHSYSKQSKWGTRFWNPSTIAAYEEQIKKNHTLKFNQPEQVLEQSQFEILKQHQAATDFCHTSLRMMKGLSQDALKTKFLKPTSDMIEVILNSLLSRKLLQFDNKHWSLTTKGLLVSNLVFSETTFLAEDLPI